MRTNWAGAMFPAAYELLDDNIEYAARASFSKKKSRELERDLLSVESFRKRRL